MTDISPREREVLKSLSEGFSAKETAERLGISAQTVRNHTYMAYKRLGVKNKVAAFRALGWMS